MSGAASDWRLTNQEDYLKGVSLVRKTYTRYSESWDHDHCSFCWVEFMDARDLAPDRTPSDEDPPILTEGYTTTAEHQHGADYHWICPACFDDFVESFGWRVVSA
jgi:hypothetical protein